MSKTKEFPTSSIKSAIETFNGDRVDDDGEVTDLTVISIEDNLGEPRGVPDANLYVLCRAIVQEGEDAGGEIYAFEFLRMCDYYLSEVGEDCGPFDHIRGTTVTGTQVFAKVVTTTVYVEESAL